jgi:hypothetical protein
MHTIGAFCCDHDLGSLMVLLTGVSAVCLLALTGF